MLVPKMAMKRAFAARFGWYWKTDHSMGQVSREHSPQPPCSESSEDIVGSVWK
jgi:hypothetical protein